MDLKHHHKLGITAGVVMFFAGMLIMSTFIFVSSYRSNESAGLNFGINEGLFVSEDAASPENANMIYAGQIDFGGEIDLWKCKHDFAGGNINMTFMPLGVMTFKNYGEVGTGGLGFTVSPNSGFSGTVNIKLKDGNGVDVFAAKEKIEPGMPVFINNLSGSTFEQFSIAPDTQEETNVSLSEIYVL